MSILNISPYNQRGRRIRGFTLVELVVVLAIMVILASLSSLALKTLGGANSLTAADDMVTGIFSFARQEAIGKDSLAAVVLITDPSTGDAAYRTFSIWEYSGTAASPTWTQSTKWRTLPEGTIVDYGSGNANSTFLNAASPVISPTALTSINFQGTTWSSSSFAYQVFLPSGRFYFGSGAPTPYTLTLVEGAYATTTPIYTHPNSSGIPYPYSNYVKYYFNPFTGEPKVVRP